MLASIVSGLLLIVTLGGFLIFFGTQQQNMRTIRPIRN